MGSSFEPVGEAGFEPTRQILEFLSFVDLSPDPGSLTSKCSIANAFASGLRLRSKKLHAFHPIVGGHLRLRRPCVLFSDQ